MNDEIIQEESLSTSEQLNLETAQIKWLDLQVYFAKGKLLIIDNSIDLIKAASLIADNDTAKISELIESRKISFATIKWAKQHCTELTDFWAVVVSPYVVAQLDTSSETPS